MRLNILSPSPAFFVHANYAQLVLSYPPLLFLFDLQTGLTDTTSPTTCILWLKMLNTFDVRWWWIIRAGIFLTAENDHETCSVGGTYRRYDFRSKRTAQRQMSIELSCTLRGVCQGEGHFCILFFTHFFLITSVKLLPMTKVFMSRLLSRDKNTCKLS
jgi:hypothetical protein